MTMTRLRPPGLIYVSGPMTGIEEFNRPAFERARRVLQDRGFSVIIPGDDETYTDVEKAAWRVEADQRASYMYRDFLHIMASSAVAVLDDWFKSPGARIEVAVAQAIGLPVVRWESLYPLKHEVVTYVQTT